MILIIILSLGGITVRCDELLIVKNKPRTARLVIMLKAGMALFGLTISFVVALIQQSFSFTSFF